MVKFTLCSAKCGVTTVHSKLCSVASYIYIYIHTAGIIHFVFLTTWCILAKVIPLVLVYLFFVLAVEVRAKRGTAASIYFFPYFLSYLGQ